MKPINEIQESKDKLQERCLMMMSLKEKDRSMKELRDIQELIDNYSKLEQENKELRLKVETYSELYHDEIMED